MEYQMCSHCVMDTSDPEIVFDEQGVCNHCKGAGKKLREVEEKRKNFDVAAFGAEVKNSGKGKKYDCIVGISGGAGNLEDCKRAIDSGASAAAAGSIFVFWGANRAVLINYPDGVETAALFADSGKR